MINAATRSVRGGASPNYINVVNNNSGINTKNIHPPFSFSKEDKTGAHSITALDNYVCATKNGSIYSDNIRAAVGEKPETPNPYIPTKTHKPLPQESFRPTDGRLANSCGCMLGKKGTKEGGTQAESFCGCGKAFMDNADSIMAYGPIIIIILVLLAAFLVARIIIVRKGNRDETPATKTMAGGVIDESFDSII